MTTTQPARYGQFYWLVETPKSLSYYFADEVRVTDAGDLILSCKDAPFVNLVLARGAWVGVSAASCMDGGEIALQHSASKRVG